MVGLPRDTYVNIPGHGPNKINAAMAFGGPSLMIRTVEGLTGLTFDYYMLTNFQDFVAMAGEYDRGLTIYVPFDMHDPDSQTDFDKGTRHLDAGRLLGMARNRHNAPHGDFDRSLNQGRIMATAHADARKRVAKDPTEILRFLRIMRRHVKTDIPLAEQLKLGLLALRLDPRNVKNVVCPGTTGTRGSAGSVVIVNCNAYFADVRDDGVLS
jgi:LCP family protein required for cell wall assembly